MAAVTVSVAPVPVIYGGQVVLVVCGGEIVRTIEEGLEQTESSEFVESLPGFNITRSPSSLLQLSSNT